jgi:hypothetical protein
VRIVVQAPLELGATTGNNSLSFLMISVSRHPWLRPDEGPTDGGIVKTPDNDKGPRSSSRFLLAKSGNAAVAAFQARYLRFPGRKIRELFGLGFDLNQISVHCIKNAPP